MRECPYSLQRLFPIDDVLLHSGDIRDSHIKSQSCAKRDEIFTFLGRQIFVGEFLTELLYNWVNNEHVTKFGDDRPSDLGD